MICRWTQIFANGKRDEDDVLQAFLPVLSRAPANLKNRQECLNTLPCNGDADANLAGSYLQERLLEIDL